MKDLGGVVILFFIALFVYTKLAGPIPFSVSSIVTTKTDSFTVTGEGKSTAVPDVAVITAGVQTQGSTVKQVQDEVNRKSNAIIDGIKKLGVDAKDIQTSNYSVHPTYDYSTNTQRITGYQGNSTLTIKVRQMEKTNSVIDAATAGGANQVSGVSFEVSDKAKAENEARELAVSEAKKKAETAAKAAGFSLGRVINYSENMGGQPPMPYYARMDAAMGIPEKVATQVEPGSSEITVSVSLSYEIR